MSLTRFRRRWAAPLSLVMIITFFATLLPPRRAAADAGEPTVATASSSIGNGFGGVSNLAMPAPSPNSPEALGVVDLSTGAAKTSFPFELPRARGQAQPELSLVYNSSSGVGFAGLGWTLDTSSIVRRSPSGGMPAFVDAVFYDSTVPPYADDDYYVDGKLLVPIGFGTLPDGEVMPAWQGSGTNWAYFRTEIDDGRRYFLSRDGQTWRVQTKDGHLLEYGRPTDGQFSSGIELADVQTTMMAMGSMVGQLPMPFETVSGTAGGSPMPVYRWNIVRDTDASSNTVYYNWSAAGGQSAASFFGNGVQYLTDIYDTNDTLDTSGTKFAHHTHLNWTSTAALPIPILQSRAPSPIWRAVPQLVVTGVDVTSAGWSDQNLAEVRRYHLAYTANSLATQPWLQSIALEGECSDPLVYEQPPATGWMGVLPPNTMCPQMPQDNSGTALVSYSYTPDVDLSGGGPALIAGYNLTLSPPAQPGPIPPLGTPTLYPNGVSQSNPWQPSDAAHAFVDVNGDGRPDLVYGALNGDHQPWNCPIGDCVTDPVSHAPVAGPYGMFVDYAPPLEDTTNDELKTVDLSNPGTATPWDLQPGSPSLVYGNWLPSGKPSWLNFQPGSSTYQIYTPNDPPSSTPLNGTYSLAATGNFIVPSGWSVPNWTSTYATDIDGDGMVDMMMVPDSTGSSPIYLTAVDKSGNVAPFGRMLDVGVANVPSPPPANDPRYPNSVVSSSQTMFADMDGDGLKDYVIMYVVVPNSPLTNTNVFFSTNYFDVYTNRGNGTFGGDYSTYPQGPSYTLSIGGVPGIGSVGPAYVQLGDLNGDGLADAMVDDVSGLRVCLRANGQFDCGFASESPQIVTYNQWLNSTGPYQSCGGVPYSCTYGGYHFGTAPPSLNAPPAPYINDIVDLDGDGLPQAVFGVSGSLQTWGVNKIRPGLLTAITSYTGLETDFGYETSAHPFPYPRSTATSPQQHPPVPSWLVGSVSTTNHLDPGQYVQARSVITDYYYDQPVYDARDRQFVGYKLVTADTFSTDSGQPGVTQQIFYATTACDMSASLATGGTNCVGSRDYSQFRLMRGLPVAVTETSDAPTQDLLRETVYTYQWNQVLQGYDGRTVTIERPSAVAEYEMPPGTPTTPGGTLPIIEGYNQQTFVPSNSVSGMPTPQNVSPVVDMYFYDNYGNEYVEINWGQAGTDLPITTGYVTGLSSGDQTGWNYRVTQKTIQSPWASNPSPRIYSYQYDAQGRQTDVFGLLSGSLPLPPPIGSTTRVAGSPANASTGGTIQLAHVGYDQTNGNVLSIQTPNSRCMSFSYDLTFQQFPQYVTSGACGGGLTRTLAFDRGFGAVTQASTAVEPGAIPHVTGADYDPFGRLAHVYQPSDLMEGATETTTPTLAVQYADKGPVRTVTTQTIMGQDPGTLGPSHIRYLDGFGDTMAQLDQTGPEGGNSQWTLSGIHSRYASGLLKAASRPGPASYLTTPMGAPIGAFNGPTQSVTYDAVGRPVTSTDFENQTTNYVYQAATSSSPAAVTILDPEQGNTHSPHYGSGTTYFTNGMGQLVQKTEAFAHSAQGAGTVTTANTYLSTGELSTVTRSYPGGSTTRTMTYDSLGRLVFNSEPNTSNGGVSGWTYAYNDNGDLVGTSDARGCGQNLYYDANGRYQAADYQPCESDQPAYTPVIDLTSGDGTEDFVLYDAHGNVSDDFDRAQHVQYVYDMRDRAFSLSKWIAPPNPNWRAPTNPDSHLATRYTPRQYTKNMGYDETNRLTSYTSGTIAPLMPGGDAVNITYNYEGTVQSIGSNSTTLLNAQSFWPDGTPNVRVYGDQAQTTATMTAGANGEVSAYSLKRNTGGPWSTAPGYSNAGGVTNSLQNDLTEETFQYDAAGHVMSITDAADPSQWNPGSEPVSSRTFTYWDDYRLQLATYNYGIGGADTQISPYQAEQNNTSSTVSTQGPLLASTYPSSATIPPSGMPVSNRVRWQQYGYDWRGNITSSTDDSDVFMDRSLGTVQTNAGTDQLWLASGDAGTIDFSGTTTAAANTVYDAAGNLTYLYNSNTDSYYVYHWDELGHLSKAAREDDVGMIVEDYAYDASGNRVGATNHRFVGSSTTQVELDSTINVFDTLVLDRAPFVGSGACSQCSDYVADQSTENIYIPMGGAGFAHVFDDQSGSLPQGGPNGSVHAYLAIGDTQGSTSFVIDHDTGELVEHATYQTSGAPESDYRPDRWNNFREDIRHTGHWDDAEVGLSYLGARYYSPQLGRFISPDPLTIHAASGDPNPYEYAFGSPANFVDPFGLYPDGPDQPTPQSCNQDDCPKPPGYPYGSSGSSGGSSGGTGQVEPVVPSHPAPATISAGGVSSPSVSGGSAGGNNSNGSGLPQQVSVDPDDPCRLGPCATTMDDPAVQGNPVDTRPRVDRGLDTLVTGMAVLPTVLEADMAIGAIKAVTATAPAAVQVYRTEGNLFRDEIAQALQNAGRDVETEVYKATPFGKRFIDIEVSQGGKILGGVETKLRDSAYTTAQRAKDAWLWMIKKYRVNVVRGP